MKFFVMTWSLWVLLLASASLQAAEVQKIGKTRYAKINAGTNEGFEKKKRVCIYDEDDKKVGCGRVAKSKEKVAYVRFSKKRIKKIKKGMTAKLEEKGAKKPATEAVAQTSEQSEDKKQQEEGESTAPKGASNIKVAYILTPVTPSSYNALFYDFPFQIEDNTPLSVSSLWDVEKEANTSSLGFGAELGLGIGSSKLNIGGRLRLYKSTTVKSYYDTDVNNFAETRTSATAVGVWADFYYLIFDFGRVSLDIGNGLDIDSSSVQFDMEQKSNTNDSATTLYTATSDLLAVSLRTNLVFNLYLDPVGLQFGTFILVPLSGEASFSATIDDPQISSYDGSTTAEEDLEAKLDHKITGFGLELFMAAYYSF